MLVLAEEPTSKKGHRNVEDRAVARHSDIMSGDEGQPEQVVRDSSPHARAGWRVPPVLHVPFLELPRGCAQNLLARHLRGGIDHCHAVLELIAKSERAARLIKRRAAPHPAAHVL